MPNINEHVAILQDSKKYDPDTFRRVHGGKIYGKIEVPKTIDILWAKLKGKSKPSDPVIPVELIFPTKSWTVEKAKKWLKDNKVKYQKFEPAKAKEKQSMSEDTAPTKACIFNDNAEITFVESDDEKKKNTFRIVGYSGGIIKNHWFWGNVAFDLDGMKFAKKRTPVLEEHVRGVRIGFTNRQEIIDKVIVEGPFLDNDNAQKLRADMMKGFPMEASLLVMPLSVEHVKEGINVEVNGLKLKGPGSVFRKSTVVEVSMCVFGADSNTKSSAYTDNDNQKVKFNLIQENNIMAEETQTLTEIESVESFAQLYPELHEEIRAKGKSEGKKEERDLFASLREACGDDYELMIQCFSEGKTAAEAMKLRVDKLDKEKTQFSEKVTELEKKKKPVEAAMTEFTDAAEYTSTSDIDEKKATDEQLKQHFEQDQKKQDEFGDFESYLAYIKHEVRK